MTGALLPVAGANVWIEQLGAGKPVVYLHGIADLHGIESAPMAFHRSLAERCTLIAPAHPGCAKTDADETMENMDDVVFHYLRVFDALGLGAFTLAGSSLGGWIAAEIAVRHPERVEKLALIGPTGLQVPGHHIGDVFWFAQPDDGVRYDGLRDLLFAGPRSEAGMEMIPDAKDDIEREMGKYKIFRFASLIGFKPPYLYNPRLRERLDRYGGPALILWGENDSLVQKAHADAYFDGFRQGRLEVVSGCGHSLIVEAPTGTADLVAEFIGD
ncbi:MAG: alpha/beta fold hydrolase [Alphaproteobacteria bacterium]